MLIRTLSILFIFILFFGGCLTPKFQPESSSNLQVKEIALTDSAVNFWLYPFKDTVKAKMDKLIAKSSTDLLNIRYKGVIDQSRSNEANLARVCADYMHQSAKSWTERNPGVKVDFTISNYGGFRVSIFAGNITLGQIYELSPFDNEIVLVQLSGIQLDSLLTQIAQKGGCPISNAEITLQNNQWKNATLNGNAFDSRRNYWVATNDFMQQGGDGFTSLKYPKKKIQTGILVREALIQGFTEEFLITGDINPRRADRFNFIESK